MPDPHWHGDHETMEERPGERCINMNNRRSS